MPNSSKVFLYYKPKRKWHNCFWVKFEGIRWTNDFKSWTTILNSDSWWNPMGKYSLKIYERRTQGNFGFDIFINR